MLLLKIPSEVLDQWFVESFGVASRRRLLIEEYKRYITNLSTVIGRPFYQWINGSFVRNIENPLDIDLVTFIDYEAYRLNEEHIKLNSVNRQLPILTLILMPISSVRIRRLIKTT